LSDALRTKYRDNSECHQQNPRHRVAEHRHRLKSPSKNPIAKTKPLKAHGLQAGALKGP